MSVRRSGGRRLKRPAGGCRRAAAWPEQARGEGEGSCSLRESRGERPGMWVGRVKKKTASQRTGSRILRSGRARRTARPRRRRAHGQRRRCRRAQHTGQACASGQVIKSPAQRASASAGGDGRGAAGQRLDGPARRGAQSAGRASGRRARGTRQARGAKARTGKRAARAGGEQTVEKTAEDASWEEMPSRDKSQ